MANVSTQSCDVCGVQRQPSNHWFKLFRVNGGLLVLGWDSSDGDSREPEQADAHICGEQHVHEWMSKHLFGKGVTG